MALTRFHVTTDSIKGLLRVTSASTRKANATAQASEGVASAFFETLGDGLRMKARLLPSTLACMLEVGALSKMAHFLSSRSLVPGRRSRRLPDILDHDIVASQPLPGTGKQRDRIFTELFMVRRQL